MLHAGVYPGMQQNTESECAFDVQLLFFSLESSGTQEHPLDFLLIPQEITDFSIHACISSLRRNKRLLTRHVLPLAIASRPDIGEAIGAAYIGILVLSFFQQAACHN